MRTRLSKDLLAGILINPAEQPSGVRPVYAKVRQGDAAYSRHPYACRRAERTQFGLKLDNTGLRRFVIEGRPVVFEGRSRHRRSNDSQVLPEQVAPPIINAEILCQFIKVVHTLVGLRANSR